MPAMAETIADRLKRLRGDDLSQQELASRSGLSWSVIAQIEQGRTKDPRLSTLRALARGLGVTLAELLQEDGEEEDC